MALPNSFFFSFKGPAGCQPHAEAHLAIAALDRLLCAHPERDRDTRGFAGGQARRGDHLVLRVDRRHHGRRGALSRAVRSRS